MRLSYSQKNQYERCPYSWYLARVQKVWKRPAAWLAQGSADHKAWEMIERSDRMMPREEARDVFRESYAEEIERYTQETPNLDYWFASGPYRGATDVERRFGLGLAQVDRYYDWYEKHPDEVIWIAPDGTPAIELSFDIDLDGIQITGFIDAVVKNSAGQVIVRDGKSGNKPGDESQLATYAVAIQEQHGVIIELGDYWMGKTGRPTTAYNLTHWPRERVSAEFQKLKQNIEAERFEPDPEPSKCMFCDVSSSCEFSAA